VEEEEGRGGGGGGAPARERRRRRLREGDLGTAGEGGDACRGGRGGRRRCRDDQRRLQLGRAAGHAPAGEVRRREQR